MLSPPATNLSSSNLWIAAEPMGRTSICTVFATFGRAEFEQSSELAPDHNAEQSPGSFARILGHQDHVDDRWRDGCGLSGSACRSRKGYDRRDHGRFPDGFVAITAAIAAVRPLEILADRGPRERG